MPCAVRLPGAKAAKALRAYLAGDDKDGASAWTPAALHEHAADANVPLNSTQAAHIEWSLRALQTELCPDEALDKADADARLLHRVARLVSHRFHRQHFHPQFISRAGPHKSLLANRIVQHPPAVALRSKTAIASAARCRAADALYCADYPLSALELEQLASSRAGTSSAWCSSCDVCQMQARDGAPLPPPPSAAAGECTPPPRTPPTGRPAESPCHGQWLRGAVRPVCSWHCMLRARVPRRHTPHTHTLHHAHTHAHTHTRTPVLCLPVSAVGTHCRLPPLPLFRCDVLFGTAVPGLFCWRRRVVRHGARWHQADPHGA